MKQKEKSIIIPYDFNTLLSATDKKYKHDYIRFGKYLNQKTDLRNKFYHCLIHCFQEQMKYFKNWPYILAIN